MLYVLPVLKIGTLLGTAPFVEETRCWGSPRCTTITDGLLGIVPHLLLTLILLHPMPDV